GHNRQGSNRLFLHTDRNERSLYLASEVARASGRLATGLEPVGRIPADGHVVSVSDTDAAPFVRRGIPTVFVAEDFRWRPGIHDSADRLGRLDLTYAGRVLTATLEAAARVARPVEASTPVRARDLAPE